MTIANLLCVQVFHFKLIPLQRKFTLQKGDFALQKGVNLNWKTCINTEHMAQEAAWKQPWKRETGPERGAKGSALLPGTLWVSNWLPWELETQEPSSPGQKSLVDGS